ncbi:uncharacterized protein CLUP02_18028 [Colletotrichum lupini]|uniref:Uncharacterized protein n=1 Tax=Colletotrichum lupini TaxID=145971 RepID=A0A9Q8SFZ7_9PEZI|nr:uncharacterized protein CLUP02_18028 [Colletotrichum lupini]UQC76515.1 hypothetical protein CLUP02_18028 [Colletotrichum lupini]
MVWRRLYLCFISKLQLALMPLPILSKLLVLTFSRAPDMVFARFGSDLEHPSFVLPAIEMDQIVTQLFYLATPTNPASF